MNRSLFISSLGASTVASAIPGVAAAAERPMFSAVDAVVRARVARDEFSGVVAFAEGDVVRFARAYGMADRTFAVPNRVSTRFNVGSLGKLFTTAVITQLAAQGRIRYTDTIGTFLPAYPNATAAATVTIRHLLDMKSGIGDIFGARFDEINHEKLTSVDAYLALFADLPLAFPAGTKEQYSNGGFVVLGAIVEAVTRQSFYDVVARDVFARADMRTAGYISLADVATDVATGYMRSESGVVQTNTLTLPAKGSPAGGVYASAADLFAFVRALRSGRLALESIDDPTTARFGYGGGAPGLNAMLLARVAERYDVVVLANASPPSAQVVAHAVAQALGGRPKP